MPKREELQAEVRCRKTVTLLFYCCKVDWVFSWEIITLSREGTLKCSSEIAFLLTIMAESFLYLISISFQSFQKPLISRISGEQAFSAECHPCSAEP